MCILHPVHPTPSERQILTILHEFPPELQLSSSQRISQRLAYPPSHPETIPRPMGGSLPKQNNDVGRAGAQDCPRQSAASPSVAILAQAVYGSSHFGSHNFASIASCAPLHGGQNPRVITQRKVLPIDNGRRTFNVRGKPHWRGEEAVPIHEAMVCAFGLRWRCSCIFAF